MTEGEFVKKMKTGDLCLHPTDSLPGIGFHPLLPDARDRMGGVKGNRDSKGFLALAADLEMAKSFWSPLPVGWESKLERLWPGPLTVVWQAAEIAPPALVREDGTLALRVPKLTRNVWLLEAIREFGLPLPSSSVNAPGMPPKPNLQEAEAHLASTGVPFFKMDCSVDEWTDSAPSLPSTIIKIDPDGSFRVLRQGLVPAASINV